jgi:hypothetical protein
MLNNYNMHISCKIFGIIILNKGRVAMKKTNIFQILAGTSLLLTCGSICMLVKYKTKFNSETAKSLLAMLARTESEDERKFIIEKLIQLKY